MAQIDVANLTFCYEGSFDNIFENASFSIDTAWKLGFIGRNGKGKTTFARLLVHREQYSYEGTIAAHGVYFDYFPYEIRPEDLDKCASELIDEWKLGCEEWRVICEMNGLHVDAEVLYRPFGTLSYGERTKVMLAVLFSGENDFLVIDEPTNHLDYEAREQVKEYLQGKKGFILISHNRDLLDAVVDHVLVLNRKTIEVQAGNFSCWWENKQRADHFAKAENEKHEREIADLKRAADKADRWAQKNEATKIGYDPIEEHDRFKNTRSFIGAKTKKMQARVKSFEGRITREIEEKEGLLQDIEEPVALKLMPLKYHKELLVSMVDYCFRYADSDKMLFEHFNLEIRQGERVFLHGKNGCGKSTLIQEILKNGGAGLKISYISQDTSFLKGSLREYIKAQQLEESLFLAILRQLDFEAEQFVKPMESYSEGQKKKVLIAGSLLTSAHLYIWDEPLNYVDVFSCMQIEELILKFQPTMLVVDHDIKFREKIATRVIEM